MNSKVKTKMRWGSSCCFGCYHHHESLSRIEQSCADILRKIESMDQDIQRRHDETVKAWSKSRDHHHHHEWIEDVASVGSMVISQHPAVGVAGVVGSLWSMLQPWFTRKPRG